MVASHRFPKSPSVFSGLFHWYGNLMVISIVYKWCYLYPQIPWSSQHQASKVGQSTGWFQWLVPSKVAGWKSMGKWKNGGFISGSMGKSYIPREYMGIPSGNLLHSLLKIAYLVRSLMKPELSSMVIFQFAVSSFTYPGILVEKNLRAEHLRLPSLSARGDSRPACPAGHSWARGKKQNCNSSICFPRRHPMTCWLNKIPSGNLT